MATRPRFLVTGKVPITIYRAIGVGEYVRGVWVDPEVEEIEREVNIQPLRYKEIMLLQDTQRTRQWWQLYCADDLRTDQEEGFDPVTGEATSGWQADEFYWQGYRYKIMKVKNYSMGVLDHYSAQAVRMEVTPN